MNENIDLRKILKDCPGGTKFYSYVHGEVEFIKVDPILDFPIWVMTFPKLGGAGVPISFTKEGYITQYYNNEKCILVPSFEQPDWSKWECPKPKKAKFDPKTLKPFDKVLVRMKLYKDYIWIANILSYYDNILYYTVSGCCYDYVLPYNDDTKHLVGTSDEAPEYLRYWED